MVKNLKADRNELRNENNKHTLVIEALEKKVEQLKDENSSLYKQLYETQTNLTQAQQMKSDVKKAAAKSDEDDDAKSTVSSTSTSRSKRAARRKAEEQRMMELRGKREKFTRNKAAKTIQRGWRRHHADVKEEESFNEDITSLQSFMRGHLTRYDVISGQDDNEELRTRLNESSHMLSPQRHRQIKKHSRPSSIASSLEVVDEVSSDDVTSGSPDESDIDDDVIQIQSAMRGHITREHRMNR